MVQNTNVRVELLMDALAEIPPTAPGHVPTRAPLPQDDDTTTPEGPPTLHGNCRHVLAATALTGTVATAVGVGVGPLVAAGAGTAGGYVLGAMTQEATKAATKRIEQRMSKDSGAIVKHLSKVDKHVHYTGAAVVEVAGKLDGMSNAIAGHSDTVGELAGKLGKNSKTIAEVSGAMGDNSKKVAELSGDVANLSREVKRDVANLSDEVKKNTEAMDNLPDLIIQRLLERGNA